MPYFPSVFPGNDDALPTNVSDGTVMLNLHADLHNAANDAINKIEDYLLGTAGQTVAVQATAPATPTDGALWYDTTAKQLKVYSGAAWYSFTQFSDRIKVVSNAPGADYAHLATAMTALGDRAPGDEVTLLITSPLAETAQVVAKTGVNVTALPGCPVTLYLPNNVDRVLVNAKTNARWRGLTLFSTGITSGTNSVVYFQGAVDNTFVLEDCWIENRNVLGGCHGIRVDAPAAPLLDRVTAKGGTSTTASSGLHCPSVFGTVGGVMRARRCLFLSGGTPVTTPVTPVVSSMGASIQGQARAVFDYCEFRADATSGGNGATVRDHAAPHFNYCRFVGGDHPDATLAWGVQCQGNSVSRFRHCSARGGAYGTGNSAWRWDIVASSDLVECSTEMPDGYSVWAYDGANQGRFQPNADDPWYVTSIGLQVSATVIPGGTVNVGTTPGGNDVINGAVLGTTGNFITTGYSGLEATAKQVIAAGGYLYATVLGGGGGLVDNGKFTLHVHYLTAYTGCNAIYFNSKGTLRVEGGSFVSNPASDALYIVVPNTQATDVSMRGTVLEALPDVRLGFQMAAVKGQTPATAGIYPDLLNCTLSGPVVNFVLPSSGIPGSPLPSDTEDAYTPKGWNDLWVGTKSAADSTPGWLDFVGDSIMAGRNASNVMTTSFVALVRAGLVARGLPVHGDFFLVGMLRNGGHPGDTEWPVSSGAPTPGRNPDWLLRLGQNPGAGGTLRFDTPYDCTRMDIVYVNWNTKSAAWSYRVDGGASTNVNTTNSKHQDRVIITDNPSPLANDTHYVVVTAGSAPKDMSIGGFACYANPTKGIGYARIHMPGDTGSFWAANLPDSGKIVRYWSGVSVSGTGSTDFGFPTQPHLAINNMLVNDVSRNPPPHFSGGPDQYSFAMQRWIESVRYGRQDASILFVVPDYIDDTYAPATQVGGGVNIRLYVDRIYRLARMNKCAVVNFKGRWGQYPMSSATPAFPPAVPPDPPLPLDPPDVHPDDAGHLDMANKILEIV